MPRQWKIILVSLLLCVFCLTAVLPAYAAVQKEITLIVAESKILPVKKVFRVAIAKPEIADVVIVSDQEVILIGKSPGVTTLFLWNQDGRASYRVKVLSAEINTAKEIQQTISEEDVQVSMTNGTVVLEGKVKDQNISYRAEQIASAYSQRVINLLQLEKPIRVSIKAEIVEINKGALKELGVDWGNYTFNKDGEVVFLEPGIFRLGQERHSPGGKPNGLFPIYARIKALENQNQAKVLSSPTLLALSGQKANFLVGGEIPVPIAADDGKVQVDWKEYGVKLDVEPVVDQLGNITAKIKTEASSLDYTNAIKVSELVIPALKSRRVETQIQLEDGGSLAIGGLIQREEAKVVQKIPLLGDLPILGKLFRSEKFVTGETELVILVTFKKI